MSDVAHYRARDGAVQHVGCHLRGVTAFAGISGEKVALRSFCELMGVLHDFGKYADQFQFYIQSAVGLLDSDNDDYLNPAKWKGKVDHASAGAQWIWNNLDDLAALECLVREILALCICSHHGGLIDCLDVEGKDRLVERMNKVDEKTHYAEVCDKADSGTGEVSDVCIKRKIRNRLMQEGQEVFVQSDDNKLDECKSLRERAETVIDAKKKPSENATLACEKWFDVRAFGQVFAYTAKSGKKGEGVSIPIRGPVSIHTAFSVDKVSITSTQITKSASGEGDGSKKGSDTMGMKHRVDDAIYVFYGSMNPQLASKTGFSDDDAKIIKGILPTLFENDASSARPDGSMEVLKVVWWQHNSPHGQYSSAKVHRSLSVESDGSVDCQDLGGLNPNIIEGF